MLDGDIGSPSNPSSIKVWGRHPQSDINIGLLTAENVHATIETGNTQAPHTPYVNIGEFHVRGDFGGHIKVHSWLFENPIVDGDLLGTIDKTLNFGRPLYIGGSLTSTGHVKIQNATGMVNQIYINKNNDGGTWENGGKVTVGSVDLGAEYTQTAASLGGGAAGSAPFKLHGESCAPVDGATIFITGLDIFDPESLCYDIPFTQAKVRLYGPMELVGAAPHVEVLVHDGNDYVDAGFTIENEIVSDTWNRELIVKRSGDLPWPEGVYQIRPLAGKVTCWDVVDNPDVDMFAYNFTLADGCGMMLLQNFDLNEDDTVCMLDAAEWVIDPVDLNGDSAADEDDFALLLDAIDAFGSR